MFFVLLASQQLHRIFDRDLLGRQTVEDGTPIAAMVVERRGVAERGDDVVQAAAGRVVGDLQLAGHAVDVPAVLDQ